MDQVQQVNVAKRQYRSFWPIIIITILAVIVGGIIIWSVFNNEVADDLSSMVFTTHRSAMGVNKTPPAQKNTILQKR